jgi:hypothetical protein
MKTKKSENKKGGEIILVDEKPQTRAFHQIFSDCKNI